MFVGTRHFPGEFHFQEKFIKTSHDLQMAKHSTCPDSTSDCNLKLKLTETCPTTSCCVPTTWKLQGPYGDPLFHRMTIETPFKFARHPNYLAHQHSCYKYHNTSEILYISPRYERLNRCQDTCTKYY